MNPFIPKTPSVFVVCSPFQTLCAIATIRQLKISDFKIITIFFKGDVRKIQIKALFEMFQINYEEVFVGSKFLMLYYMCKALMHRKNNYTRLFIGDLRNPTAYYIGYNNVSDASHVVFLDDGNMTINYLKGTVSVQLKQKHRMMLEHIALRRLMNVGHNYLTIYGDINSPKNLLCQLDLGNVITCNKDTPCKDIFIVGTYAEALCTELEISVSLYIQKLNELMRTLRLQYPNDTIYFIPHGREILNYGERLCKDNQCIFRYPQMMIELELLKMPNPPKVIYGYTSSALYTLKKMFPKTKVVNILIDSSNNTPFFKEYINVSNYYLKNGIEFVRVPVC